MKLQVIKDEYEAISFLPQIFSQIVKSVMQKQIDSYYMIRNLAMLRIQA